MIILDTIAYNTFFDLSRGKVTRKNHKLKERDFMDFITNYTKGKYIHGATLFEIYIKSIKRNDYSSIKTFARDFNELKKYDIKILNENTWYFDWQSLVAASDNDEYFDPSSLINDKVKYEVTSIGRYFMYIFSIVCDKLFTKYGNKVGLDLFHHILNFNKLLIDSKLKEYLFDYYTTDQRKEASTKQFDLLLGYLLNKLEIIIKDQITILKTNEYPHLTLEQLYEEQKSTLIKLYKDLPNLERLNLSGVEKAREILKDLSKKDLNDLITTNIDEIENLAIQEGKRSFTSTEKLFHQSMLLPKALQQGYKVTKNDFTDCCISSAFDCVKEGHDGIVITFDKTLRKFIKENNIYYDETVYNQISK